MTNLLPLFVNLNSRRVVLVGAGAVAAAKLTHLLAARADVFVVAPEVHPDFERAGVVIARREFVASDLDGAWLVVAAAPPSVNRAVAVAAETRRVFVNAVDDPSNATAFLSGVVRRDGVTVAISTSGSAPGLTALVREALDAVLPRDLGAWVREARRQRTVWRRDRVPMAARRPLLLEALNRLYEKDKPEDLRGQPVPAAAPDVAPGVAQSSSVATDVALDLNGARNGEAR
jgi:uroporphyrin-III C-methyltransferase/precorrin-2 dehydrogenase/sirohydrochlorin ferrochelatase